MAIWQDVEPGKIRHLAQYLREHEQGESQGNPYEVWLRQEQDEGPKLYGEYMTEREARQVCETIQLTTKGIRKLFIAHVKSPAWEQYTGKRNMC